MEHTRTAFNKITRAFTIVVLISSALALGACKESKSDVAPAGSPSSGSPPPPSPSPGPGDTTSPSVTITAPTTASSYTAGSATLNIGGNASDNVGVSRVSWRNDRGGSGNASGTGSWSVNGITLQNGANVITVTAYDAANNSAVDTLTVNYSAPSASFVLEVAWAPNSDSPDGYTVYIGGSAGTATTAAKTLVGGASDWDPNAPFASIPSSTVLAAVGSSTQVCARIRAYNGAGVSNASNAACANLP